MFPFPTELQEGGEVGGSLGVKLGTARPARISSEILHLVHLVRRFFVRMFPTPPPEKT